MPELPEVIKLARQAKTHLVGKTISNVEVMQPKSLNMPVDAFCQALTGAEILDASNRGKWIIIETTRGWLLISLGMGGELLLTTRAELPEKHRLIFDFTDGSCISLNFWWFGYAHYAAPGALEQHHMVGKLGPNALDLNADDLRRLMNGKRGTVKSFLLDQSRIAGIGNSYIHDILFLARLHPLRKIESLREEEYQALSRSIHDRLQSSLDKGGAFYELDLFGQKGGFTAEDLLIGYREGQPCPVCGMPVEKIKTGSTSGFLCPSCQPIELPRS